MLPACADVALVALFVRYTARMLFAFAPTGAVSWMTWPAPCIANSFVSTP
jgi:hypothetical protein